MDTSDIKLNTGFKKIYFCHIPKTGGTYSNFPFVVKNFLSPDGRVLTPPENVAFEFYDLDSDITGVVK